MVQVIIVAEEAIHEFLTSTYNEWDTQVPVNSISEMWNGLSDGTLSTDSSIVIISDQYFDNSGEMEIALATLAPAACVIVISYTSENNYIIQAKTDEARESLGADEGAIYFIDPNNALDEIDEIVEAYFNPDVTLSEDTSVVVSTPQPTENVGNVDVSRDGIVIASTSSKGGSGKSTVAILLAATTALASEKAFQEGRAERPLDVCIVDMDVRDGQVGFLIGQTSPTALNIRVSPDWGPETIKNNLVYDERMKFHALLAPKRGRTADDTGPEFYRGIIRNLRKMFDVVILDTSVNYLDELISTVCLPEADAILFVTNMGVGSVFGMTRWFEEVRTSKSDGGLGIPLEKIGVVANQSLANVGMDKLKLTQAALGATLLVAIPLDTEAVVAAGNYNRLGDLVTGHPAIGPAYYRLARKVLPRTVLEPLVSEETVSTNSSAASTPQAVAASKPTKKRRFGR